MELLGQQNILLNVLTIDCPWRVNITWPETALKIKLVSFIIMNLPLIQLTAQLIKIKAMFNLIKEMNCQNVFNSLIVVINWFICTVY